MVDHDGDGDIIHVRSWQKWTGYPVLAGIVTPPMPFTRSPEYDPDESAFGSRPVGETIVLETLDRAEPSLVGSDAPTQPPRDVMKAVDVITVDAADLHHFGHRGRLGRSDWVEPTSHESATQMYAMRLGIVHYYGNVTVVVYDRTAVQAANYATEHHCMWHAPGTHA